MCSLLRRLQFFIQRTGCGCYKPRTAISPIILRVSTESLPIGSHRTRAGARPSRRHRDYLRVDSTPDSRPSQTQIVAAAYVAVSQRAPRCRLLCAGDRRHHAVLRLLRADKIVLSLAEKTSLQPRPRLHPTQLAQPEGPNRVEREYRRAGVLNLFAAFDTRTGRANEQCLVANVNGSFSCSSPLLRRRFLRL